ncbi:hypothetical protein ACSQ67_024751 [Phaseolus vulgaris]
MRLQQLILFLLLLLVTKANGSLLPFIDPPRGVLAELLSDRFPDPFHVLEQIPFGVEKDEQSMIKGPRVVSIAGEDQQQAKLSTDGAKQEL